MKTKIPKTPECQKLLDTKDESQKLGYFLEFLFGEMGLSFGKWTSDFKAQVYDQEGNTDYWTELFMPAREFSGDSGIDKILAVYFKIDLDKVEEERAQLLKWLQENQ